MHKCVAFVLLLNSIAWELWYMYHFCYCSAKWYSCSFFFFCLLIDIIGFLLLSVLIWHFSPVDHVKQKARRSCCWWRCCLSCFQDVLQGVHHNVLSLNFSIKFQCSNSSTLTSLFSNLVIYHAEKIQLHSRWTLRADIIGSK